MTWQNEVRCPDSFRFILEGGLGRRLDRQHVQHIDVRPPQPRLGEAWLDPHQAGPDEFSPGPDEPPLSEAALREQITGRDLGSAGAAGVPKQNVEEQDGFPAQHITVERTVHRLHLFLEECQATAYGEGAPE
jgi:hypothetical protein